MDTRSALRPLIKSPELAEREEATRSQLFTLIPGEERAARLPPKRGSERARQCPRRLSGVGLPDHPGSAQASLPLGFKGSSEVPSCLLSLSECLGDPDVALWGTGPRCVSRRNVSALYLRALTCSRGCHSVTTPLAWGFGKNACDLTSGIPH